MGVGKFKNDLAIGQDVEIIVLNYLKSIGCEVIEELNTNNKFDFKIKTPKNEILTYEIKSDYQITPTNDTGNIYIEYQSRGKDSGIRTSNSNWYCYYFVHLKEGWFIQTNKLKELLAEDFFRSGCAIDGDGSKSYGYLIPRVLPEYKEKFIVKKF